MLGFTLPEIAIIAIIFALITIAPRVAGVGERLGELLFARDVGDPIVGANVSSVSSAARLGEAGEPERDIDQDTSEQGESPRDPAEP